MARSETGYVLGKLHYPDLNLTQYPDKIDSRVSTDPGYNANMKGFENIKDYNMAEHINAVGDAVMAIQRSLGTMPSVDKDAVDRGTVNARITILENKDYDPRYGGAGWILSQTLVGHTHTGEAGHPSQINLVSETQGKLPKGKLNIAFGDANAVTGGDLVVSNTDARKIADAINDKLSITQGGTVQKGLEVKGGFQSRVFREFDASMLAGGTLMADVSAMTNQIRRTSGAADVWILSTNVSNLLYGRYVIAYRLRVSSNTSTGEVFRTAFYNANAAGAWVAQSGFSVKANEFNASNQWQTFYQTVEHKGDNAIAASRLDVVRTGLTATAAVNVDIDNIIIMPTHPAIYDR